MIRIVNVDSFCMYNEKEDITKNLPSIKIGGDVFKRARYFLEKGDNYERPSMVRVVDDNDNTLFFCYMESDILRYDSFERSIDANYNGESLINIKNVLDLSIIEQAETYCFEELDEYVYEIASLIKEIYPEKKLVFSDKKVEMLFDIRHSNIQIIDGWEKEYTRNFLSPMWIQSVHRKLERNVFSDQTLNIYNSLIVMSNLCWAKNRIQNAGSEVKKTAFVIDYSKNLEMGGYSGPAAIIRDVSFYVQKVKEKGWIPVVELSNTQYSVKGQDFWHTFFEGVSKYRARDINKFEEVVMGRDNGVTWNPYSFLYLRGGYSHNIKVNFSKSQLDYMIDSMPKEFISNKRILGVIARGSDLRKSRGIPFNLGTFLNYIKKIQGKYDYIFLASEEQAYIECFQKDFGEKVIYVDQMRVSYDYDNKPYISIGELMNLSEELRTEFVRKYLLVVYLLSKCHDLVSNTECGAKFLATQINNNKYVLNRVFYQSDTKESIVHKLSAARSIHEFINNNSLTIVYGIGHDSDWFLGFDVDILRKVIFVDKRAREASNLLYKRTRVISPECIRKVNNDCPILIMSRRFEKEIFDELISMNIMKDRIYILSDFLENKV